MAVPCVKEKTVVSMVNMFGYRDSPVVQGNCILALSGLAVVLSRYESSLPAQSDGAVEVRSLI